MLNGSDKADQVIDQIALSLKNLERIKRGLSPLTGNPVNDFYIENKTWILGGALAYAGYWVYREFEKRRR